jgi:hypothetical protein
MISRHSDSLSLLFFLAIRTSRGEVTNTSSYHPAQDATDATLTLVIASASSDSPTPCSSCGEYR